MARDIETYLRELRAAMASAGADPALVQDALFDAEEHLRAEMAVGGVVGRGTASYDERFAAVSEGYGSPGEVAAAYLGTAPYEVAPTTDAAAAFETALAAGEGLAAGVQPVIGEAAMFEPTETTEATPAAVAPPATEAAPAAVALPATEAAPMTEEAAWAVSRTCERCGQDLRPAARFCTVCGTAVETASGADEAGAKPAAAAAPARPASAAPVAATPAYAPTPSAQPWATGGRAAGAPIPVGVQAGMAAAGAAAAAGTAAQPSVWKQIFGVFVDAAVWKALLYMILSLGTGIAYFTIVVTGLSTGVGMLVLIVGIPLFLLVLGMVRALSLFEGRVVELLLGTRMPRRPRAEPPDAGFFQRMWFWVKDSRTWASVAYLLLMLPLGIIYFTIAVTGLATGIGLIAAPLWGWIGDYNIIYNGVTYDWWFPVWGIPLAMILGVIVLVVFMHLVKWIGRGHAAFAKAMLVRLAK